jgi:hypothetical protein
VARAGIRYALKRTLRINLAEWSMGHQLTMGRNCDPPHDRAEHERLPLPLSPFERAAAEWHALGITLARSPASGAPIGQPRKTMPDCGPLRIMPEAVLDAA